MPLAGHLRKALSPSGEVLLVVAEARNLIQAEMSRLQADPAAMIHLGQALMGVLLLQALGDPSEEDRLQAEWLVKGPFGNLYAEAFGRGRVRGIIGNLNPGAAHLGGSLGEGLLSVRKTHAEKLSSGTIESTGQVSTDIVQYLEKSEQRLCGSQLSVKIDWDEAAEADTFPFRVRSAHAYLIHVLPAADETRREDLLRSWDAQMKVLGPLSSWKLAEEPSACTQDMLDMLSMAHGLSSLYETPLESYCNCSQERAARALTLLKQQGDSLPEGSQEIRCEFCGARYVLS